VLGQQGAAIAAVAAAAPWRRSIHQAGGCQVISTGASAVMISCAWRPGMSK
jgi:hypothetical protein